MEYGQEFDEVNKIWSRPSKSYGFDPDQLVGVAILNRLKILDQGRVLEINHGDNGKETTVAEMRRLTITCAKNLETLGIQKGDVVVFFSQLNSLTTPTCYGCFISGAIVSPLVVTLTDDDTDHVLEYLDPTIIIYDDIYKEKLEGCLSRINGKKLRYFLSTNNSSAQSQDKILFNPIENLDVDHFEPPMLGDPKKVVLGLPLTSGSSGKPKAIQISHNFYLKRFLAWWEEFENMRFYIGSPFGWITQFLNITHPVFSNQIRVYSGEDVTSEYIAKVIHDSGITHLFCVTKILAEMVDFCKANNKNHYLKTLKRIMAGGAPVTDALRIDTLKVVPECLFCNGYGMTEVSGAISSDEHLKEKLGMGIQRGVQLRIVDKNMNALEVNKPGIILIKVDAEFLGYYKNEKANKESFIDGWLVTGDFGYMDEHHLLHVLGRYKDLIFCDGKLIIPSRLEALISNHPAVLQPAVIPAPHQDSTKGNMAAVFFTLTSEYKSSYGHSQIKTEIENILKEHSFGHQIHSINIVEKFEYLSSGKLDKNSLKSKYFH